MEVSQSLDRERGEGEVNAWAIYLAPTASVFPGAVASRHLRPKE